MSACQTTTTFTSDQSVPRPFIWLGAIATGVIVTNLFAPQILVGLMGRSLGTTATHAGMVSTLTLLGYAFGLFFLVPLTDIFENKRLIVLTLCSTVIAAACTAVAPTTGFLLTAVFLLGASCSAIQMLVPLVASMARPSERGRVIGDVMSGLMVGILLSRPIASFISDAWNWRGFYVISSVAIAVLAIALSWRLPSLRPKTRMNYLNLLGSYWTLIREEPVLRVRSWTAALSMAAFSAFWAAVALKLAEAPFNLGASGIAIFALAGAAGAVATPVAGRLGDAGHVRVTLCASHALIIISLALSASADLLATRTWSLVALGAGAVVLDLGVTGDQILGRRAINLLRAEARGRLNGMFVGIFFIGGAIGTAAATFAWAHGGWVAVCTVAGAFGLLALITDMATSVGTS
ncbi:putative MFS family arabinose efflux permease [Nitrobacteraceae bacterium AZCC 1564]